MQFLALSYEIAMMRKHKATIPEIRARLAQVCEPTRLSEKEVRAVLRNSRRLLPTV